MNEIIWRKRFTDRARTCKNKHTIEMISKLTSLDYNIYSRTNHIFKEHMSILTLVITIYDTNILQIIESVESAVRQTYINTEVILIDHGTTGLVKKYINTTYYEHENVKLIVVPENYYPLNADEPAQRMIELWNAALLASIGNYIFCLSCDDYVDLAYAEKMANLFERNPRCIAATPGIISVDENSIFNQDYKCQNVRDVYESGVTLCRDYMHNGGRMIGFPGEYLCQNSDNVINNGGFDVYNDISQLFRFSIFGDVGYDNSVNLYWRHHANQSNKLHSKNAQLSYRVMKTYYSNYSLHEVHANVVNSNFANHTRQYFDEMTKNTVYAQLKNSARYSIVTSIKIVLKIINRCPPSISMKSILLLPYFQISMTRGYMQRLCVTVLKKTLLKDSKSDISDNIYKNFIGRSLLEKIPTGFKFAILFSNNSAKNILGLMKRRRLQVNNSYDCNFDVSYIDHSCAKKHSSTKCLELVLKIGPSIINEISQVDTSNDCFANLNIPELRKAEDYNYFIHALVKYQKPSNIVQVGTSRGVSLIAMLVASENTFIDTFDLIPISKNHNKISSKGSENINKLLEMKASMWRQHIANLTYPNVFECFRDKLDRASLIIVDIDHTGIKEMQLLTLFKSLTTKQTPRVIVWNGIHISTMQQFWRSIDIEKADVSSFAHYAGTGITFL